MNYSLPYDKISNMMIKTFGKGCVKILAIYNEANSEKLFSQVENIVNELQNISVTLAPIELGESKIEEYVASQTNGNQFTLIIDVSDAINSHISGFGDRYKGILEKIELYDENVKELDNELSKWFLTNYHFSTIQIGQKIENHAEVVNKILNYMNGKKKC